MSVTKRRFLSCFIVFTIFLSMVPFQAMAHETMPNEVDVETNNYPIILVHGCGGWGRDERGGFLYWGGEDDIEEGLRDAGFEVYTAAVGPFSSNWDRACELYAFIKGGTVDYGEEHSRKHGHERFGRTYPGVYPEWGTKDENGNIKKIHLMGHSQGGQTVRMLEQLLTDSRPEERGNSSKNESLFAAKNSWVQSVTTLASPNDGTTLADVAEDLIEDLINYTLTAGGSAFGVKNENDYYDFKLDQWGLRREPNESFSSYVKRVKESSLWKNTKDVCVWDLSVEGAAEQNKWVKERDDVYYFSYSCMATRSSIVSGHELPQKDIMNPMFWPNAVIMGRYEKYTPGTIKITPEWFPNDGWVNTISQDGPKVGRNTVNIREYDSSKMGIYDGTPVPGIWNHLGILTKTDHEDIIGRYTTEEMGGNVVKCFVDYAEMLKKLKPINSNKEDDQDEPKEPAGEIKNADIVTKVNLTGEKVVAVVLEYDMPIDGTQLSRSTFNVIAELEGSRKKDTSNSFRTITNAYTNNSGVIGDVDNNGKYIVLELRDTDSNAITRAGSFKDRYDLDYSIIQNENIYSTSGKEILFKEPIKHTGEINLVRQDFANLTFKKGLKSIDYRFFEPEKDEGRKYPLVLFLHGIGETGSDNEVHLIANQGATIWAEPKNQEKNPCYVVAPQANPRKYRVSDGWDVEILHDLLVDIIEQHPDIDIDRIYITGLSMGGFGTWSMIQEYPELFAAAMPICGAKALPEFEEKFEGIKDMPIWIFHAKDDNVVPILVSDTRVRQLEKLGTKIYTTEYPGNLSDRENEARAQRISELAEAQGCNVIYTKYTRNTVTPSHYCWETTYTNDAVRDWLFRQSKSTKIEIQAFEVEELEVEELEIEPVEDINLETSDSELEEIIETKEYQVIESNMEDTELEKSYFETKEDFIEPEEYQEINPDEDDTLQEFQEEVLEDIENKDEKNSDNMSDNVDDLNEFIEENTEKNL